MNSFTFRTGSESVGGILARGRTEPGGALGKDFTARDVWDSWVAGSPDPHPEQMTAWGQAQSLVRWNPLLLTAYQGNELVGGVQILEKSVRSIGRVGYLFRGPIVRDTSQEPREALLRELTRVAKARRHLYTAVVLPYGWKGWVNALEAVGFQKHPSGLPPVRSMADTSVLDLDPSLEDLLAQMRPSTRKNVRQGLKRGLKVRLGDAGDLPVFDRLLDALCKRRGVKRNVPPLAFLRQLWDGYRQSGILQAFVASYEEEPVAILLVFAMGGWVREWRIGWNGEHDNLSPNELLRWEVIRWAKEHGFRKYDFSGVDGDLARKVAQGEEIPIPARTGPTWFKLGFGGRHLALSQDYCYFPNPLIRGVMRNWGERILKNSWIQRRIQKLG